MKKKSSFDKLSKKTKRRIFEAMLKVIKKQMVNMILNSSQEEVCEIIKGGFGDSLISAEHIVGMEIKGTDNLEVKDALYDIAVNIKAMELKSKGRDELYEEFS